MNKLFATKPSEDVVRVGPNQYQFIDHAAVAAAKAKGDWLRERVTYELHRLGTDRIPFVAIFTTKDIADDELPFVISWVVNGLAKLGDITYKDKPIVFVNAMGATCSVGLDQADKWQFLGWSDRVSDNQLTKALLEAFREIRGLKAQCLALGQVEYQRVSPSTRL